MFQLIDSILPLEVCLYHQVLPLSVEGSRMNLGMVNPEDTAALDYIRRILAYIKCSLVPRSISSEVHQAMLSAYLSYADKKKKIVEQAPPSKADRPPKASPKKPADTPPPVDRNAQATLILDSPDEIELARSSSRPPEAPPKSPEETPTVTGSGARDEPIEHLTDIGALQASFPAVAEPKANSNETLILKEEVQALPDGTSAAIVESDAGDSTLSLPELDVRATHLNSPIEVLGLLPPKNLMHELLARVLAGGIGRLFLERQQQHGRILWSQDGVLQSALEDLSPSLFQGVINEFKHLNNLPLLPIQKPREVEIERLYQGNRLLLRFRFMPGINGEEATVQVLRGAALKFHQQQQLAVLGRDALGIAKQLQRKLSEISERATTERASLRSNQESLTALNQMLMSMKQQIQDLEALTLKEGGGSANLADP
ncbi:hypothetical protein [Leptolyngbya sp. 'hensonii']|uniref:ATPase, T2SS/T4P/T4SS family n=1 Tax=Leptolyngbya sp. 'hensonii' TaxID=1922337 RepID=UPI001C0BC5C5|nr:hypothetical protein [Leptolyngbya sp. 'hensonii']